MKKRIDILRRQLDILVKDNADFQEIYRLSLKLDSLIAIYYRRLYIIDEKEKKCVV